MSGPLDTRADLGAGGPHGTSTYDATTERYTISVRRHGGDDQAAIFVHARVAGDFILSARVRAAVEGASPVTGMSARASLDAAAPEVTALAGDVAHAARVIQIERRGGRWTTSVAVDGEPFTASAVDAPPLPDEVYVGLVVRARTGAADERALVDNVRLTIPARPDFVPYRDYIGSNLEIVDVDSGDRVIVHRDAGSIQAPNWTRDGRALVYNQDGLLYRFDLATRTPTPIDTGFATRHNNDHVLSFDGTMLGVSHHSADDDGRSVIYTVPLEGGVPRRVTAQSPSYLHGWSPDGRTLVFAGLRDGEFDVYTVPASGGDETRLTHTVGVDDGPEFTPDGAWIYFNSFRTGRMQIWRMRPDGAEQEQVTDEPFNDWFPHVSPDGTRMVYLAFPLTIRPGDHPFYERVYLMRRPLAGGASTVLAYVYGGQGTINVPSWSPDGRRVAFVSNTTFR